LRGALIVATSEDKRRLARARKERHIARLARGEISLSIDIQPDALWDALIADELVGPDEEPTRAVLEEQARRAVIDWILERLPRDPAGTRSFASTRESLIATLARGRHGGAPQVLTGLSRDESQWPRDK
jgi:hypothetical protein